MKKSVAILVTLTALSLGALAQAPSPAQAPEMQPVLEGRGTRPAGGDRGAMGERGRWGGGMENREFGIERLLGAIATGQELGKKLNLTPEQQELMKKLLLDQREKMVDHQAKLQKAALKQTDVLMADPLDEKALMEAVEETSKVRTEMAKGQIQILIDVRKALTEEQRKTLRELMLQAKQQQPPVGMRPGEDRRGDVRKGERREEGRPARGPGDAPVKRDGAPVAPPLEH